MAPRSIPALVLLALLAASCAVRRELSIRSQPPGASVRLDGRNIGTTPVTVDFGAYGTRLVTLYLDGYHTHAERIRLKPPWYARFPLDIVSEVLLPLGWRDRRVLRVRLEPGQEVVTRPSLRSVLERADVLRRAGPTGPTELPAPQPRELPPVEEEEPGGGGS